MAYALKKKVSAFKNFHSCLEAHTIKKLVSFVFLILWYLRHVSKLIIPPSWISIYKWANRGFLSIVLWHPFTPSNSRMAILYFLPTKLLLVAIKNVPLQNILTQASKVISIVNKALKKLGQVRWRSISTFLRHRLTSSTKRASSSQYWVFYDPIKVYLKGTCCYS